MKELFDNQNLSLTKEQITTFAEQQKSLIDSGFVSPLERYLLADFLEKSFKEVKKHITQDAIEEAEKYSKADSEYKGVGFQVSEVGVKYDYSKTPIWEQLEGTIKELKAIQKEIEAIAKVTTRLGVYVDDDGVEHPVYPPIKSSTTSLKVTIPKK